MFVLYDFKKTEIDIPALKQKMADCTSSEYFGHSA